MYRLCPRCGRFHTQAGKACAAQKVYADTPQRRLRARYAWAQKSQEIRARSQFLCAVCKALGDYTPKALEVHHIVKLSEREDLLLDDSNLICLCVRHHKEADAGRLDADELRRLAAARDADIPPAS